MANGAGSPDCSICRFVVTGDEKNECGKHKFIIPKGSSEKLCNDWQHYKGHSKHDFRSLSPGILYYYSYASSQPPAPLDNFEHFHNQIEYITLPLVDDPEFGWALYYRNGHFDSSYIPDGRITIDFDDWGLLFEVTEAQRIFHGGGRRQDDGSWKKEWSKGSQRIIHCPNDPDILYKWMNRQVDVERALCKFGNLRSDYLYPVRLLILCEPDGVNKMLRLRLYMPMYGEFARHT
jgi:hypothetical protein